MPTWISTATSARQEFESAYALQRQRQPGNSCPLARADSPRRAFVAGIPLALTDPREDSLVRITNEHPCSPAANTKTRVSSQQTDNGFASTLASAVESSDGESDGPPPEFSAATYRLFAAIDLERGDTKHAALHLSRVADAREAGIPLHPSGVLSEIGRWDYTEAAAALPETGRFDTASGQGAHHFIPYNVTGDDEPAAEDCAPTATAAAADATVEVANATSVDRLRGRFATLGAASSEELRNRQLRAGIEDLLDV